jgi:adenylate kinase family enzyme
MQRILILGNSGAGKSTLARRMAAILRLPAIHLDRHYWLPGWREPDPADWAIEAARLARQPAWIIDGNFRGTLALRLKAADTVVHLDFPTWLCLARVLRRLVRRFGRMRGDDVAPGCPERLDWTFIKDISCHRRRTRPQLVAATADFAGEVHVLRRPGEVRAFIERLEAGALLARDRTPAGTLGGNVAYSRGYLSY